MALYKRKTFLINPRFQIKFSLYVAILFALSTAIYPYLIYELYSEVALSLKPQFPNASSAFIKKREGLMLTLCIWQLSLTFLIFLVGIFLSHKIAGPLFKLRKFLKNLGENQSNDKLYFRDGDYFKEVAEDYNKMIQVLEDKSVIGACNE